jgi:hypothetical protein
MYLEDFRRFLISTIPLITPLYHQVIKSYLKRDGGLQEARDFQRLLHKSDKKIESIEEPGIFDTLEHYVVKGRFIPAKVKEENLLKSLKENMKKNEEILFVDKQFLRLKDFAKVVDNFSTVVHALDYELGSNEFLRSYHTWKEHPLDVVHRYESFLKSLYRNWYNGFYLNPKSHIKWGVATYCMLDAQGSILPRILAGEDPQIIYTEIPEKGISECLLKDMSQKIYGYTISGKRNKNCKVNLMKKRVSGERFGKYLQTLGIISDYIV